MFLAIENVFKLQTLWSRALLIVWHLSFFIQYHVHFQSDTNNNKGNQREAWFNLKLLRMQI